MEKALNRKPWIAALLLGWLLLATVHGHVVEQLFINVEQTGVEWRMEVMFDAGYADAESRGNPDEPQPTREWLVGLSSAAQRELCERAATYLSECLEFSNEGIPVAVAYEFVDFRNSPPDFPILLTGGAYVRIQVTPEAPSRPGQFKCEVRQGDRPNFVVKIPAADGENLYLTIHSGGSEVLWKSSVSALPLAPAVAGRAAWVHAFYEGFLHVIPNGLDHLLFVMGLFLLCRSWRPLLWQSLAFTCAHTLTLGLAAAGVFAPRSEWVEPLIALSIASLAVENLFQEKISRWRLPLVFGFGLVHGMGFAAGLSSLLTLGEGFLARLVAVNLGVEVAQVAILAGAWLLTWSLKSPEMYPVFRRWANGLLAVVALVWFFQRLG